MYYQILRDRNRTDEVLSIYSPDVTSYDNRTKLVCFDVSGCFAPFSARELEKVLDERTLHALDHLIADQELKLVCLKRERGTLTIGEFARTGALSLLSFCGDHRGP